MYNEDTELIFPNRVIQELRDLRGAEWRKLVDKVKKKKIDSPDQAAFVLMMARVDGCMNCSADSFRAMKGCTQCAQDAIRRYRGDDNELLKEFDKARKDIDELEKKNG
jgi:predicted secreted protein